MKKKVRLIETFAGYGSQALALERAGLPYEHHCISEWNIDANRSYSALHLHKEPLIDYSVSASLEEVKAFILERGMSLDDKVPVTAEVLERKSEIWCRDVYNVIKRTHNLGSITAVSGKDLNITDTEKYVYMLTYSFPCVDLSTSGRRAGMKKGSGTRSGLLWEIERILCELKTDNKPLPQVLFMENVKQVVGQKNRADFEEWCVFLESLGYTNTYKLLNSLDFDVAQSRERCFMVSILKNTFTESFEFPVSKPLTHYLRDYLDFDNTVSERLFLDTDKNVYAGNCVNAYKGVDFINTFERYNRIHVLGHYTKSGHESSRIVDINGVCPTVKENHSTVYAVMYNNRVRKLSVLEFGRLMGLTDQEILRILSAVPESKARKQFGNSIVVDVMTSVFSELFKDLS